MLIPLAVAGALSFPALSVQVPEADCPAPSELNVTGALQEAMPERASNPLKLTVTSVLFQPLAFGAGEGLALAVGAVASLFMVTDCELVPPALVAEHVSVWLMVSVVIFSVPHPLEDVMVDSASVTVQLTVTSEVYHPLLPNVPDTLGVITGGVVSETTIKVPPTVLKSLCAAELSR
jgi:hypothetical protein